MSKLKLYGMDGKSLGEAKGSDKIFSVAPKQHVVNEALIWFLAKKRKGTASAKVRDEVSGGGRKPWKQKGTGRARAGDNRMPHWVGGGVVFPPKPRDFGFNLPKKVRKTAIKMVLSDRAKEGRIKVVESLEVPSPKTKEFVKICKSLKLKGSALFVNDKQDVNVMRASRNIPGIKVLFMSHLNVHDLLKHEEIVLTKASVSGLEGVLK